MEAGTGFPLAVPQFPYLPRQTGQGRKCQPAGAFVTFANIYWSSVPFAGTVWGPPPGPTPEIKTRQQPRLQQGGVGQRQTGACPVN